MTKNYILTTIGLVSLLLSACAPELARTNYGPEEQQWKDYIQKSYNGWSAPPTPAPYSENNVSTGAASSVDTVPPASTSDIPVVAETSTAPALTPTPTAESTAQPVEKDSTYIVQKGDTLWSISQKVYGNGSSWKLIKEANRNVLAKSNTLKSGMVLKIPAGGK